ncbi:unnamed protein product, partial [marine sediment metagenome]
RFWAFRALRRPGEAALYPGDRAVLSGYFFKGMPVVDGAGRTHWMPLVVGPWPSYAGKWWPLGIILRKYGLQGLLPTSGAPHEEVWSRLVVDLEEDGRISVDGAPMCRDEALAELRRSGAAHPGRAVVARCSGEEEAAAARELLAEGGVRRACFKELPRKVARDTLRGSKALLPFPPGGALSRQPVVPVPQGVPGEGFSLSPFARKGQ